MEIQSGLQVGNVTPPPTTTRTGATKKNKSKMNKIMSCNKKGNAKSGLEWEHG